MTDKTSFQFTTMAASPSSSSAMDCCPLKNSNQEEPMYFSNEDRAIFGSLTSKLSDTLSDLLNSALTQGVSSLPMVSEERQQSEALLAQLQSKYFKNVDVVELYASRNIFTVGMYPLTKQQAIVQAYLKSDDEDVDGTTNKKDENASPKPDSNKDKEVIDSFPPKHEIPTPAQMLELELETHALRDRLQQARRRRTLAQRALSELRVAQQLATAAATTKHMSDAATGTNMSRSVHETVTTAVTGMEALEELQAHGRDLLQQMQDEKRERKGNGDDDDSMDEDDDDDGVVVVVPNGNNNTKQTAPLSLEERYEQERLNLAVTTVGTVDKVLNMLVGGRNKENSTQSE